MRTSLLLSLFLGLLFLASCTEEQRTYGRAAEAAYVDLLYALYQDDQATATAAANAFNHRIQDVRKYWRRPMREEDMDMLFFHLENAEWIFAEARESIEANNLELAITQLDRATYELSAADPASFQELYLGNIYGFFASWMEVDYAVGEADLCVLEWREFTRHAKSAQRDWRGIKNLAPSELTYPPGTYDVAAFTAAKAAIERHLDRFMRELKTEDQCGAQLLAKEVTRSVWDLLLLFGSDRPVTAL
ncbi:MAG: hypothetical protein AAFN92_03975 [Bacteroidota bacterium]